MIKHTVLLLTLLLTSLCSARADGILMAWSASDVPGVSEQSFNDAKSHGVADITKRNLEVSTWADAFLLLIAANAHQTDAAMLQALASQLTDNAKVSLKSTSRLIIWERITSGEIQFEGKGYQVD